MNFWKRWEGAKGFKVEVGKFIESIIKQILKFIGKYIF